MNVVVIGGGPAGMMAAYAGAQNGHKVTLIEQNEKLGKKLFITGKGRCNITNAGEMEDLFANVMSNRKFLYSAFYAFDNRQVIDFFNRQGLRTKIERGNRVFPESDHSSDVIAVLKKALAEAGAKVMLGEKAVRLLSEEEENNPDMRRVCGVELTSKTLAASAVIVATGGFSYQSTGSTGDGYRMAKESGHRLVPCTPSLVPLAVREDWVKDLQGLSLKNTAITIYHGKKKLYEDFGEMLFTHFGVSGPMILSASGSIRPELFEKELTLVIDLKPALDLEQLDKRILRDFEEAKNRKFKNSINHLFPAKLVPVILSQSDIDPDKPVNEILRGERRRLAELIKHFELTVTGTRDWNEAIITKGGVSVKDVNPSTMESKRMRGLYFCGEVLDLDALTGGYNLQIAWSTGYLAGASIADR